MKVILKLLLILAFSYQSAQLASAHCILMTSLYNEQNPERLSEYITCLVRNSQNRHIKKIHVVYDTTHDRGRNLIHRFLQNKHITVTLHQGRPSFQFFFDLANQLYPNETVIVSNADIYFNETLANLEGFDLNNIFIALTRWEKKADGFLRPLLSDQGNAIQVSQDTWIFKTPIPVKNAQVQLGTYNCEHKLNLEVERAGLQLLNPCLSLICCHLHLSNIRHYAIEPTPEKVYHLPWCYLPTNRYRCVRIEL